MKKTAVIFVLLFTLSVSAILYGCGSAASSGSGVPSAGSSAGLAPESSAPGSAQDSVSGETPDDSLADNWAATDKAGSGQKYAGGEVLPFDHVIADREDLYFAIEEVREDGPLGYVWKVRIENRTDKNLMFTFEKVSVNGVMCDPYWAEVVTAGRKDVCEITWMRDALEKRQISSVYEVGFTLNVYNDDVYTEAPLMHDPFTVYPLGEERAAASGPAFAPADPAQILVDDENCTVMITGYDPGSSWGFAAGVYLRNKTGEDLVFSASNTSVNGIMCEPYWTEIVVSGKSAVSTILWDRASLRDKGISEVEQISLPLCVYSDKDIGNPYVDETFELKP